MAGAQICLLSRLETDSLTTLWHQVSGVGGGADQSRGGTRGDYSVSRAGADQVQVGCACLLACSPCGVDPPHFARCPFRPADG